ncbi:MAG: hypothetical protein ACRD2L_08760, partial [Terriglobia bacterium]
RTEGEPAKPLSWWVRDVRMVFLYGDVEGMWLQTVSEATATVRILGRHTIVSQNLKYDIDKLVATGPQRASQVDSPLAGLTLRNRVRRSDTNFASPSD